MSLRPSTRLALLDSVCRVTSSDRRWPELTELMWAPFIQPDDDSGTDEDEISVEPSRQGFEFREPGEDPETLPTPWEVVNRICGGLFRRALKGTRTFLDLHAGVIVHDDQALLLVGDSGIGKTTLVLELLRRRPEWIYYSDDLAPIRRQDGLIAAFPKPLSVKDPERWEGLSAGKLLPDWLGTAGGAFWLPPTVFVRAGGGPVAARRLYFLTRGEGRANVARLSAAEAVMKCLPYTGEPGKVDLAPLASLCRSVQAFTLDSSDADDAAELLSEAR